MHAPVRVLVVDDDPTIRELVDDYLGQNGFDVVGADDAACARRLVEEEPPALVLLDVGLPGEDGLSLARYLREELDVPIIMVSGAGDTVDRVVGLEVGADDYVTKPFHPRELLARIRTVLRRYQRGAGETPPAEVRVHAIGGLELDVAARRLTGADGGEIALTRMEFDLLRTFLEHPKRVLSRDQLLNLTQNRDWDPYDRSIDIRVARLRRKIEASPDDPQLIRTVRGVGYMYVPPES